MAHAQKPDLVFQRNGRVHLNWRGASVQSTAGSRCVRISGSNDGYTMFRGRVQDYWIPTPLACFPLHFPYRASPCAIRFQLSSTNSYNKKTKWPTLMELFAATRKMNILTPGGVRCVHHRWYGTQRYDIQVLSTHASTWVHRYSSLLQWSVPLGQQGHVAMVGRILCTKCTLHSNHRLTRVIFQNTKRLLPRSGHFLTTHTRIA